MPAISIVMPVYNVEPWLRECLDSVRAQTFTDWECICVDDGSTDASPAILDEYAAKDSRFRVFRREHSNAGACRNVGMDLAQGEFLSFLDSDDVFSPKLLKLLHDAIEKHQADIATCGEKEFLDGNPIPLFNVRETRENGKMYEKPAKTCDVFSIWFGHAWDKLFRKSFISQIQLRFQEIHCFNDAFFVFSALSLSTRVVDVEQKLVAYRKRTSSLQRTKSSTVLSICDMFHAYDGLMRKWNAFCGHSPLEHNFHRYIVRAMSRQMDTVLTGDAYATIHSALHDLCAEFDLGLLVSEDFPNQSRIYERFCSVRDGRKPVETLWNEVSDLRKEVQETRQLRGIDRTHAYRIGRAIMFLPKLCKSVLHGIGIGR